MSGLFSYDNRVFSIINRIVNLVLISLVWVTFCIPVVTFGASTTAFYYAVNKNIRKDEGHIFSCFWKSFRENFKQSTVMWLVIAAVEMIFFMDAYIMRQYLIMEHSQWGYLFLLFGFLMMLVLVWGVYLFAYTARFQNTTKESMKNAAILAGANPARTILIILIVAAGSFVINLIPVTMLIVPGVCMLGINGILERVFRKYSTEE